MREVSRGHGPSLATVLSATFIGQFDFFVTNVAAPDIQVELGANSAQLELVVAAYAFCYAAGLVTGGRLGDLWGRRRVFASGLIGFAVTSALCGIAPSAVTLIAFRALQGLSAAVLLPQVLAFITTALPPQRRGWAMGWFGVASGLGSIGGQGLGGLLVDADLWGLGWRLVFLVNIPVMAVALIATLRFVPVMPPGASRGVDVGGALALFTGMAGLMAGALLAQQQRVLPALAVGAVGLVVVAATMLWQGRRARAERPVMVDPSLFTARSMRWGGIASAAFLAYFASFMFVLTVMLQQYSGLSPLLAGLVFVPSGITFMTSSLIGSRWIQQHLRGGLLLGCAITSAGLAVTLAATMADARPTVLPWWLLLAVSLTGLGNGLVLPTLTGLAVSDVDAPRAGMASGVVTTLQQFGAAFGVAGVGALFYRGSEAHMARGMTMAVLAHLVLLGIVALACVAATRADDGHTDQERTTA